MAIIESSLSAGQLLGPKCNYIDVGSDYTFLYFTTKRGDAGKDGLKVYLIDSKVRIIVLEGLEKIKKTLERVKGDSYIFTYFSDNFLRDISSIDLGWILRKVSKLGEKQILLYRENKKLLGKDRMYGDDKIKEIWETGRERIFTGAIINNDKTPLELLVTWVENLLIYLLFSMLDKETLEKANLALNKRLYEPNLIELTSIRKTNIEEIYYNFKRLVNSREGMISGLNLYLMVNKKQYRSGVELIRRIALKLLNITKHINYGVITKDLRTPKLLIIRRSVIN